MNNSNKSVQSLLTVGQYKNSNLQVIRVPQGENKKETMEKTLKKYLPKLF